MEMRKVFLGYLFGWPSLEIADGFLVLMFDPWM
jgi:hypothetical protein